MARKTQNDIIADTPKTDLSQVMPRGTSREQNKKKNIGTISGLSSLDFATVIRAALATGKAPQVSKKPKRKGKQ